MCQNLCVNIFFFIHIFWKDGIWSIFTPCTAIFPLYCCSQFNWKPEKITSLQQISVKLLRGRESVQVFYCLLIYALSLEIQLSRDEGADSITYLSGVTFLCLSQDRTYISNIICCGLDGVKVNDERWLFVLLIFVDINWLNCILIIVT